MTERALVVFPRPLRGEDYRSDTEPIAILARRGEGVDSEEYLIVDRYGNCDWRNGDSISIKDAQVAATIAEEPHDA